MSSDNFMYTEQPNEAKNRTVVCIAGMHRSGTSMIAQLLNLSGIFFGDEAKLMPPHPDNPKGYWENLDLVEINESVLKSLGGGWDFFPVDIPDDWAVNPALSELLNKAKTRL